MKTKHYLLTGALLLAGASFTFAQDADKGPGKGRPPHNPLLGLFDTNKDGTISADEIAAAPAALKALDKNGDGQLTKDELRPPRPAGAPDGKDGPRGPRPDGADGNLPPPPPES